MTKILVTGAAGYIGRHVVDAFLDLGVEVIAVSRNALHPDRRALSIQRDFADITVEDLRNWGAETIVHLAWVDGFKHDSPAHLENLPKHVRFVSNAMEARVERFVGLGTMHEVGYWEGEIDEATPTRPRSMYGVAKNALRDAARIEVDKAGATFLWLRAYYILGDDERNSSIFAKIVQWEKEGRATFPFNSGTNKYDFIDVDALARQIAAASLQSVVSGVIECCSGRPVALRDQVEEFIADHGFQIRPEYGVFPDRTYDSPAVWGSVEKISKILNACRPTEAAKSLLAAGR
jgi:dTDP-6-deoxy-L-talose 4-dehydrogenase (NAD+)